MKVRTITLLAALLAVATQAHGDADLDGKRKLYALGKAGAEYCPGIETGMMAMGAIGYKLTDAELPLYQAQKQEWFNVFKQAGNRAIACEMLMQQYGPGADFQMFWFK